jgi:hypothetical protein
MLPKLGHIFATATSHRNIASQKVMGDPSKNGHETSRFMFD